MKKLAATGNLVQFIIVSRFFRFVKRFFQNVKKKKEEKPFVLLTK
jgi:hypothetical protein